MVKKIIGWFIGAFLGISAVYYIVCKIINTENAFTNLVDSVLAFLGGAFIWVANHILAILIVVAIAIILIFIYYKIKKDKGKDL